MQQITSQTELEQLHRTRAGFIYNDYAGPRGSTAKDQNVLHRSGCRWISEANINIPKFCSDSIEEAVSWLEQNRGPENVKWKQCETCTPQSGPKQLRSASRLASPSTETTQYSGTVPFRESEVEKLLVGWFQKQGYQAQTQVSVPSGIIDICLLYTSDAADDLLRVDLCGHRII